MRVWPVRDVHSQIGLHHRQRITSHSTCTARTQHMHSPASRAASASWARPTTGPPAHPACWHAASGRAAAAMQRAHASGEPQPPAQPHELHGSVEPLPPAQPQGGSWSAKPEGLSSAPRLEGQKRSIAMHVAYVGTAFRGARMACRGTPPAVAAAAAASARALRCCCRCCLTPATPARALRPAGPQGGRAPGHSGGRA